VRGGFFPLDEELGLLPKSSLTPALAESAVRLGVWAPFGIDVRMREHFTHTCLSEATLTRLTERAGAAYVAVQTAQVSALDGVSAEQGPPLQQVSVDGAFVPLGGGHWTEVKTLAVGTVQPPVQNRQGEGEVHTTDLSYFSRRAEAATFADLATVEIHRRGVLTAGTVAGVVDGALGEQSFLDLHRPDAVRILDWGHAVGYLADVARAVCGADTPAMSAWLAARRTELYTQDPAVVLGKLRGLQEDLVAQARPGDPPPALTVVTESLAYLEARAAQMRYAEFRALGSPIGSGIVESGNKLVIEARLKGAGMHGAPAHVTPLVALRAMACSDRWEEAWPQITAQLRQEAQVRTLARRHARQARVVAAPDTAPSPVAPAPAATEPVPAPLLPAAAAAPMPAPQRLAAPTPPRPRRAPAPRRPAATHPWRTPFRASSSAVSPHSEM
jgi:hypothetical protein